MAFRDLLESLGELLKLYGELHELGLHKKDAVVHNRLDELTKIVARESRLLKQIAEHDKARVQAIIALQSQMGKQQNPHASLTQINAMLPLPEEKRKLGDIQRRLAEAVNSLKQLNELNQQLIQQSIDFVDYTLDLMVGPSEDEVVYRNPKSRQTVPKRSNGFDYRT